MLTGTKLERLEYNPETGDWTWRFSNSNVRAGTRAGYQRPDGYRLIRIDGTAYYSGRLAWVYMTGKWPENEIDHIDRDPSNDRWSNLREATSSQNKYNRIYDLDGPRGVYRRGNKWMATVGRSGYLGMFDSLEEAIIARDTAALEAAGEFAILNQET